MGSAAEGPSAAASHLRWLHLAGVLSLAGWATLVVASHHVERPLLVFLAVMAWEWMMFLVARRAMAGGDDRRLLRPVLAWAAAFLVCGTLGAPMMEDDFHRFLWDGRQFAVTGNPYAGAPAASFGAPDLPERFQEILDQVNYPHVPTIYGPICQFSFLLSYWIAPGQLWPWKLLLFASSLSFIAIVVAVARLPAERAGGSASGVANAALTAGWCPLLIFEAGFNAHPDILGITLLCGAVLLRMRALPLACGVVCGMAVAAKVFAVLLVPFLLVRSTRAIAGFVGALLAAYGPFWLQGSTADWAGLMALALDWEFNSSLFAIARWSFGPPVARLLCGSLFLCGWVLLFLRWIRLPQGTEALARSMPGAGILGLFLLLSATVNPWYLLWLAPFLAWRPAATGLAALALVSLSYITGLNLGVPGLGNFEHPGWVRIVEYGAIALVALLDWRRERRPT